VALVSDGSRGIGAATVRGLAEAGWDVSFCHRGDEEAVREVEKAVSELGRRVLAVEVDVTDAAGVASWFQRAQDELGPVQAAVSCAGITRDRPLARLEEADWRAVLDTGLDGMFHICQAAMFAMMPRRSGRIVAVSSICGAYDHSAAHDQPAHLRRPHYWPARAGIAGFVPALSALTSRFGVSINAVTPGLATHDMTAILPELTRADLTETVALRRFDDASDVAKLVTFLLSAACDSTGRVLEVRSPIRLLTPARKQIEGQKPRSVRPIIMLNEPWLYGPEGSPDRLARLPRRDQPRDRLQAVHQPEHRRRPVPASLRPSPATARQAGRGTQGVMTIRPTVSPCASLSSAAGTSSRPSRSLTSGRIAPSATSLVSCRWHSPMACGSLV